MTESEHSDASDEAQWLAMISATQRHGSTAPSVEHADPALWYRYIQELVFSGQTDLAEAHLRRFRELHPDFVYQP